MTQPESNVSGFPSSQDVSKFHTNCDCDAATTSQHHTLGQQHTQASPGDHLHDGKNSKRLGKGKDLTFPTTANATYSQAQMQSVINALRVLGWGS